jgi:type VI protein secretion system component Hcp
MKKLALLLFLLGATSVHAATILVLNVNGVSCTTTMVSGITEGIGLTSWNWGAVTPMSGVNGVNVMPGKTSLAMLVLNKNTDECSSALLALNLGEKISSTVTITEYNNMNNNAEYEPTMIVTLTHVILASYSISGSTASDPTETLGFTFSEICLANKTNNTSACYNSAGIS